jgi:hypothetical protein
MFTAIRHLAFGVKPATICRCTSDLTARTRHPLQSSLQRYLSVSEAFISFQRQLKDIDDLFHVSKSFRRSYVVTRKRTSVKANVKGARGGSSVLEFFT